MDEFKIKRKTNSATNVTSEYKDMKDTLYMLCLTNDSCLHLELGRPMKKDEFIVK